MIHVDRTSIPKPEFWDSPPFQDFLKEWCQFHGERGGSRGTQQRMPFGSELDNFRQQALWPLLEAFHGKCAYTEQKISEKDGVVVFHRPEADAMDENSGTSPEHYWWGVCDWNNWYPACRDVQIAKGTLFPVAGERSSPPEPGSVLSQRWLDENLDRGLLLDPGHDHPAWYLEFREDGTVSPRQHPSPKAQAFAGAYSRGDVAIRTLDLNNTTLSRRRASAIQESLASGQAALSRRAVQTMDLIQVHANWTTESTEFLGAIRQLAARRLLSIANTEGQLWTVSEASEASAGLEEEIAAELVSGGGIPRAWIRLPGSERLWLPIRKILQREWPELNDEALDRLIRGTETDRPASISTTASRGAEPALDSDFALSVEMAPSAPSLGASLRDSQLVIDRSARVESVEIHNFKAIENLHLPIPPRAVKIEPRYGFQESAQSGVNWTALLGENSSGKSCCLQAIALALAGDEIDSLIEETGLKWRKLLRRGTQSGSIALGFTGGASVKLCFDDKTHWWDGGAPKMAGFVRGYGATRLLEAGTSFEGQSDNVRLANLLNPRAPVLDAETWLLGLAADNEGDFNAAALTLSGFLGAEVPLLMVPGAGEYQERFLQPSDDKTEILAGGDPLSYASDGYRAVVALVCDIMAGLGVGLSDMRNATGIVLIDEIGAHLHPRWKMEITSRLRREFPRLQFFVSTHEPLCLRGLRENEVVRVRKTRPEGAEKTAFAGRVEVEVIERSPSAYRVDQLLTSEFFGLDTTIDPDLDRRFQAYYRLLAMTEEERVTQTVPHHPSRTLEDEFRFLRDQLRDLSPPVLGFTRRDQLAYEAIDRFLADDAPETRRRRREQTLDKIRDIWTPPDFSKQADRRSS